MDALGTGLPIVTLPGQFMRGRQTMAMLKQLGLPELIAQNQNEFAAICARLCTDNEWRRELGLRLASSAPQLFSNKLPLEALAAYFETMVGDVKPI